MSNSSRRNRAKQHTNKGVLAGKVTAKPLHRVVDPLELVKKGDYKRAVHILQTRVGAQAHDEDRRLLCYCLLQLERYDELVKVYESIEKKDGNDWGLIGWAHIQLQEWERAIQELEESLRIEETAEDHYLLAVALAKGDQNSQFDKDSVAKQRIIDNLERGILLPRCREEVYLWLASLQGWKDEDIYRQVKILEGALSEHPKYTMVRHQLASRLLYRIQDPKKVLEIIDPLIREGPPDSQALWYAFAAHRSLGNYESALACLESLPSDHVVPTDMALFKGDTLLDLGRAEDALFIYSISTESKNVVDRVHGLANSARAWLALGRTEEALRCASEGLRMWLQGCSAWDEWFGLYPYRIGSDMHPYSSGEHIEQLCVQLLESGPSYTGFDIDLEARLTYLLYKVREPGFGNADAQQVILLDKVASFDDSVWLGHPGISHDLKWRYYGVDLAKTVHYHLQYCVAEYTREPGYEDPEFDYGDDGEPYPINKRARVAAHKAALKHLIACDASEVVRSVHIPFYNSFWYELLLDANMHKESAQVTDLLLRAAPDDAKLLFRHAYSLNELGRGEDAIGVYRRLIELQPDNVGALHNLSLPLCDQGKLIEAEQLAERAAGLAPNDEVVIANRDRIRKQIVVQREKEEKRLNLLKSAPSRWVQLDRYKRQLLATLTVISEFDGWEELAQLSGIGEKYLPGHWRKLVELGMIIEKGQTFEVNEYIRLLAERERSHALVSRIIRATPEIAYKPIFNSLQEHTIYRLLLAQFPNHLVFPNMALQAIFQYVRMKELVPAKTFDYFLRASVDFCVTSTESYLPLVAFEVDSHYHDDPQQQERDTMKDEIFRLGGVSLLRLRAYGQPSEEAMKQHISETLRDLRGNGYEGTYDSLIERAAMEVPIGLPDDS